MGDDYYIGWQADRGAAAAAAVASPPPHCAQGGRMILGEKFFLTATGFADRRFPPPPPWLSALVLSLGSKGHVTALLHGRRRCRAAAAAAGMLEVGSLHGRGFVRC